MMPAPYEYYSKHSRKVSASQMSLPDQLQNTLSENANRSLTFLPATTYIGSKVQSDGTTEPTSPDAYYHSYQNQFAQSALRQGALRTIEADNVEFSGNLRPDSSFEDKHGPSKNGVSIGEQQAVRSHISSPGLRGRKSSVKNLVEQYNATSKEEFPPVPVNSLSRNGSRNVSPVIPSQSQLQQPSASRQLFNTATTMPQHNSDGHSGPREAHMDRTSARGGLSVPEMIAQNRRPLFGEVVPGPTQLPIPGYGIEGLRRRSGSEGSPLPSPNIMLPQDHEHASRSNYNAITMTENYYTLSPTVYNASNSHPRHRRANSESPSTPTRMVADLEPPNPPFASGQHRNQGASSRIPVSVRRGSATLDVDGQPLSSTQSTPVQNKSSKEQKQSSPRRRPRSPPEIQSPGQRGKKGNVPSGPKSPSLRANIIIPPPKISPPLRSSRPRLPVSSASTTASRAKMAEKFSAQQRMNEEKRQAARRVVRPPELSDIDFKARRHRITQALTRSLEGQDLKGSNGVPKRRDFSTSRTASPAYSARSETSEGNNGIPAVVVDATAPAGNISEGYPLTQGVRKQERAFSHNALDAIEGKSTLFPSKDDSPTVAQPGLHYLNRPARLETDVGLNHRDNEPSSAMTEGTMFDHEPQEEVRVDKANQPIIDHVSSRRDHRPARRSTFDTFSDHDDQESVQIFLRDTVHFDDDDEAIQRGYQPASPSSNRLPRGPTHDHNQRSSWVSSFESDRDEDAEFVRSLSQDVATISSKKRSSSPSRFHRLRREPIDESVRSTMASDAYTIVNIVLQQHSTSGVVDQQFVDDVYQSVLDDLPFGNENSLSQDRIEQICLREIRDREESWYKSGSEGNRLSQRTAGRDDDDADTPTDHAHNDNEVQHRNDWLIPEPRNLGLAPPPLLKGHRYKSSLGSAEDWADTSPSVSDWIRYAAGDDGAAEVEPSTPLSAPDETLKPAVEALNDTKESLPDITQDVVEDPDLYSAPVPRAPAHAPPPLPVDEVSSNEETNFGSAVIQRPQIPRRVTSVSQIGRTSPRGRQSPSISAPVLGKMSLDEPITPEQRRLKQRKNVIKELVDTEFSYEKDLRVLCDIYKQTASAALGEDDIRVLFGNVEQVQLFSKDFLMLLKSLAKPTYAMERPDRKKEKAVDKLDTTVRPHSSSSTLASNKANESELPSVEKDRETRIGQAFEASLADMEKVYTEYIKNRHAANLRLEQIQKSHGAREWLKECKENSSDITNAWNLDALLVKPVQRITKYPLLIKELVDSTTEDHPDLTYLRRALHEITEVNIRINDVKKHAELVDQVLNRKRKDSDVRAGFSKAFGRRAEKLKQHVGMTELYEDSKYNEIKIHYDNNIVQLMVVGNDCSSYGRAITRWVNKMVEIAAAAEAWVDVGHSNHQEAESKLRQFAMVVRGISTIALPDHLEQLNNKVLVPMQQAVDFMTKFKSDPKGLLQKREKRMLDYAQLKSKKDRGEKIDRKMTERIEQSEALNVEAKERMRKLVAATAKLVQACQAGLIQMQISWHAMVRQKLSAAMGISLDHLEAEDIVKEWQLDFDFQEATALALGVCNGSLLAEAVNMVNFQGSTTTLNGEESPRQASFTSTSKRSISGTSENSYPPLPDYDPRTSGTYVYQYEHTIPYANPRARAQSATSNRYARTPDMSHQGSATEGVGNSVRADMGQAPRLSVETPSPSLGTLQPETSRRPTSSSTFFSAPGTPPLPQSQNFGSGIFSSALPMSDSPVIERFTENGAPPDPDVLFTAASVYEFNIDRSRREAGFPYLTYVTGEIFDVIGERGELWLAKNQDDPTRQVGWIWNKHFAKLAV